MAVPQQLVIERIRARCDELEDRYPGYRKDLVTYLAEVLTYVRAAETTAAKQVEAQLEAFGDLYHRRTHETTAEGTPESLEEEATTSADDGEAE